MRFHRDLPAPSIRLPQVTLLAVMAALLWLAAIPVRAATLIRDPDIEHALAELAAPVLRAAGLAGTVRVLVVQDPAMNAFVIDTRHIYVHSGMIQRMARPEMLQAVIAHEAAHIANGHIARRMSNIGTANTAAGLGIALAIAAAAATGNAQVGTGLALGTQAAAQRRFLAHTRAEEASADQSGVRYMARAGIDPQGAVDVHDIFRGQELLNTARQDPYVRSHPLTRDRMRAMKAYVAAYGKDSRPQPAAAYWFARAKGKLDAFVRSPKWTLRRADESPTADIRHMRLASAHHRLHDRDKALRHVDKAIALRPEDAYYHELKGQILLESRNFSAAVKAYGRAVDLAPYNALCLGGYGRALLAAGRAREALKPLEKARARDFRDTRVLRDLGLAYARTGNDGMASLAAAERYALLGQLRNAAVQARRAAGLLPQGTSGWRRAQDIIAAQKRAESKR